jgi:sec-independent protein translocase protein TatA
MLSRNPGEGESIVPDIGVPELLIVALVVLLLFGPGKAADLGSSLGKGIREFRRESTGDHNDSPARAALASSSAALGAPQTSVAPQAGDSASAAAARVRFCTECGSQNRSEQKFCSNCGTAMAVAG